MYLVKGKHQNIHRAWTDFCVLNDTLVKINYVFSHAWEWKQFIGQSHCEDINVADLMDAHETR